MHITHFLPSSSLITLAVQNASLTIVMHYSRVSVAPSEKYSAASAVLMVELLKGSISLLIALSRVDDIGFAVLDPSTPLSKSRKRSTSFTTTPSSAFDVGLWTRRAKKLRREVISADCWKLSIPAILYVIQNNLQFVAASNLDVATFQVTYQMKILTTAAFSVLMLGRRLTMSKWLALLCLALGVGIVQIQSGSPSHAPKPSPDMLVDTAFNSTVVEAVIETVQSAQEAAMNPFKGFMAVSLACMTSGLAGVYFEMVLKGSKADLWVRNVQLSMFSIVPAIAPILFSNDNPSAGWFSFDLFRNFGFWAWCTVFIQVFGGLVTAVVIKYSDNILKGFATSLSIVFSFLASVALFDFSITPSFVVGATTVLAATATYNKPEKAASNDGGSGGSGGGLGLSITGLTRSSKNTHGTIMSPASPNAPIIGGHNDKKRSSIASLKSLVSSFNLSPSASEPTPTFSDAGYSSDTIVSNGNGNEHGSPRASPNGMDLNRYAISNAGTGNHSPHTFQPPPLPPPRTPSNDLYNVSPQYSPYTKPLSVSSSPAGYATPVYASRAPSLRSPSPKRLPSSEYIGAVRPTGAR